MVGLAEHQNRRRAATCCIFGRSSGTLLASTSCRLRLPVHVVIFNSRQVSLIIALAVGSALANALTHSEPLGLADTDELRYRLPLCRLALLVLSRRRG